MTGVPNTRRFFGGLDTAPPGRTLEACTPLVAEAYLPRVLVSPEV